MRNREYEKLFSGYNRDGNYRKAWNELLDDVKAEHGEKARSFVEWNGLDNAAATVEEYGLDEHPWFAEHPHSFLRQDIYFYWAVCTGYSIADGIESELEDYYGENWKEDA